MLDTASKKLAAIVAAVIVLGAVACAVVDGETPAALTLLGAAVVAGVAAWTAEHRLGRQLGAAAARHERELQHDREERAADRAHERDLAELAEVRRVLDDATITVDRVQALVAAVSQTHSDVEPIGKEGTRAWAELQDGIGALDVAILRATLRLGDGDGAVAALDAVTTAARTVALTAHLLRRATNEELAIERRAGLDEAISAFARGVTRFQIAAIATTDGVAARLGAGNGAARESQTGDTSGASA